VEQICAAAASRQLPYDRPAATGTRIRNSMPRARSQSGWETGRKETDLYLPLKRFLEVQHYEVK
jgi:hypothetical protein